MDYIVSRLVRDGFGGFNNRSLESIALLDRYQLLNQFFRKDEEDEEDDYEPTDTTPVTYQDLYVRRWQAQGFTLKEIRKKWEKDFPPIPVGAVLTEDEMKSNTYQMRLEGWKEPTHG